MKGGKYPAYARSLCEKMGAKCLGAVKILQVTGETSHAADSTISSGFPIDVRVDKVTVMFVKPSMGYLRSQSLEPPDCTVSKLKPLSKG
jgi:hypothetical protein